MTTPADFRALPLAQADPHPSELPELIVEPVRRPVMTQRWADVVFLHWPFEPAAVQRLLPPGVHVDTFNGAAWVALVPFRMERLAVAGLPPFPLIGTFPEVNVRTYVHARGRRGVWFFSLDVNRLLPTAVARLAYQLPYCFGAADHRRTADTITTAVERRWPRSNRSAAAEIEVKPGSEVRRNHPSHGLYEFLTSRWGLISASPRGRLRYAAVDHEPWDLRHAEIIRLNDGLVTSAGLPAPADPPVVLWSPGVDVRVGFPTRLPIDPLQ